METFNTVGTFSATASLTAPFGDGSAQAAQDSNISLVNGNLLVDASGSITDNVTSPFRDHALFSIGNVSFSLDAPGYFTLTGTTAATAGNECDFCFM